jgi:hypothetical protein
MSVVKTKKINDITVNIHDDCIPKDKEEYKKNLKIFYDTINIIFRDKNKLDLFYTEEELKKLKNDRTYEFI